MAPRARPRRPAAARRHPPPPPHAPARQRRAHPHPGLGPRVDRPAGPADPRRAGRRARTSPRRRSPRPSPPSRTSGFVTREIDPDDRRVTRVSGTAAGRRHLEEVISVRTAWLEARLADLGPDDRTAAARRPRRPRGAQRRPAAGRLVTRACPSPRRTPSARCAMRNFRLFFLGQLDLPDRHLADDGRPDPARPAPHRLRHRPRPARRLPVRPGARCSAPGPAPSPTAATSGAC